MNGLIDDRFIEERINGVIYLMARPNRQHLRTQGNIITIFNNYFRRKNKKCEAVFEDEINISKDDKIIPDVLVYCYDCDKKDKDNDLALIVIEVLSKSTRKKDLNAKKKKYAELGIQEYWVVDYNIQVMDIYILENGHYDLQITCGIEDIDDDVDEEEHKDLVSEFTPTLFPDLIVKAEDIFYSVI